MDFRTTVTLDEHLLEQVRDAGRRHGKSFKDTLNDLVRLGLAQSRAALGKRELPIQPRDMGVREGINYSKTSELLDLLDGFEHR